MVALAEGQTCPLRLLADTRVVKVQNRCSRDLAVGRLGSTCAVQQPNDAARAATVRITEAFACQSGASTAQRISVAASPSPLHR
jgi:hypothetical protein